MFNLRINMSSRQAGKTKKMKEGVKVEVLDLIRKSNKLYKPITVQVEKRYVYAMADIETNTSNIDEVIYGILTDLYAQGVRENLSSVSRIAAKGVTDPILHVEIGGCGLEVVFYTVDSTSGFIRHRIMLADLSPVLKANKKEALSSLLDEMFNTLKSTGIVSDDTVTKDGASLFIETNLYIDDLMTDNIDDNKAFVLLNNRSSKDHRVNVEINRIAFDIPTKSENKENKENKNDNSDSGLPGMKVLFVNERFQ